MSRESLGDSKGGHLPLLGMKWQKIEKKKNIALPKVTCMRHDCKQAVVSFAGNLYCRQYIMQPSLSCLPRKELPG